MYVLPRTREIRAGTPIRDADSKRRDCTLLRVLFEKGMNEKMSLEQSRMYSSRIYPYPTFLPVTLSP
jgi:hypothetical protein